MKQYRLQPGTSSRIYYLLTVKDKGTLTLEFHGTDRVLTEDAAVNQDGWIVTNGAMYPPLTSGKWNEISVEDVRCHAAEVRSKTAEVKPKREVRTQKPTLSPYERLYCTPVNVVGQTEDHSERNRKIFAAVATALVFVVLVNTVGLFGVAALGLLAGGVIK